MTSLSFPAAVCALCFAVHEADSAILVEAEGFAEIGGWVVDPQFMDNMGSLYLLAHGLGQPVADARTTVDIPVAGKYKVWVRTKDWVVCLPHLGNRVLSTDQLNPTRRRST